MTQKTGLALKPCLEEVETLCQNLSHHELSDFVCQIAQKVPSREQSDFIEKLKVCTEGDSMVADIDGDLLSRIRSLEEEIADRHQAIDDGSFYEDYDGHDWGRGYDYHDDEGPDPLSQNQKKELETLLSEADHLFLSNESEIAAKACASLLRWFRSDVANVRLF